MTIAGQVDDGADAVHRRGHVALAGHVPDEVLVVGLLGGWAVEHEFPLVGVLESFEDGRPDSAASAGEQNRVVHSYETIRRTQ